MTLSGFLIRQALQKAPPLSSPELDRLICRLRQDGSALNHVVRFMNEYLAVDGGEYGDVRGIFHNIRKYVSAAFQARPSEPRIPVPKEPRGGKTGVISLRLTPAERQRMEARAVRQNMPVSVFLLRAALGRSPPLDPRKVAEMYMGLQRIGINLRQAVTFMEKRRMPEDGPYENVYIAFLELKRAVEAAFGWEEEEDGVC